MANNQGDYYSFSMFKWYQNQDYLSAMNLASIYDHFTDEMRFRYETVTNGVREQWFLNVHVREVERMSPQELLNRFDIQIKRHPSYRHEGPTNKDLEDPTIRNAWEAYLILLKLKGVNTQHDV